MTNDSTDASLDVPLSTNGHPADRPAVRDGPGGTGWVVSIMGGHDRRGHWRIAKTCNVVNLMGGGEIDLREVDLSHPETQLNVYSVMGGSDIRVPPGVRVEVSKFAVMGGHDVRLGDEVPPPDAPLIRIRLLAVMGGCSVRRGPRRGRSG